MYFHKVLFPLFVFNFILNSCAPIFYNKNLDKWTKELSQISKKEYHHLNDINELTNRKHCGMSLKHLAGLVLDKSDKDAKLIIEGSIFFNKLILKLGNIKEKEIEIKNIVLPIETLSNKCINIRQIQPSEDSTILCLSSKVLRNFWINSISDAVLCKMTKLKGKLPEFDYMSEDETKSGDRADDRADDLSDEQNDDRTDDLTDDRTDEKSETKEDLINTRINNEEFDDEQEEEKKGVQLRIGKSKFGQPDIKINGKTIEEIKEKNEHSEESKNSENGEKNNSEEYENASNQIDNDDDEPIES